MSTSSSPTHIMRRWLETWNTRDASQMDRLADEFTAPDYILHDPNLPNPVRGVAGLKQFVHDVLKDRPDIRITVEDLFGEDDKVAIRFTVHGTSVSTGQTTDLPVIAIVRFAEGKAAEAWQHSVTTPATTS